MGLRRRYAIVTLVLVAAATAIMLFAPKNDELGWIRQFGGRETVRLLHVDEAHDLLEYRFDFPQVPDPLHEKIRVWRKSNVSRTLKQSGSGMFSIASDQKFVSVIRIAKVSWFEQKWRILKTKVGLSKKVPNHQSVTRSP